MDMPGSSASEMGTGRPRLFSKTLLSGSGVDLRMEVT